MSAVRAIPVVLLWMGFMAVPVAAQNTAIAQAGGDSAVGSVSPLDRPARLLVRDASLADALTKLHVRAGVNVLFSPSMLPDDLRVTCECTSITVRAALGVLLGGTELRFRESEGHVLVYSGGDISLRPPPPAPRFALTLADVTTLSLPRASAASALAPTPLGLPATGTVAGVVRDARSLEPVGSAQVHIAGLQIGALTQANGRYLLLNVPEGDHEIRVERIGYRTESRQVSVTSGQSTEADFDLTQDALSLDGIVVTGAAGQARRREVGNSISQIDAADLSPAPVSMEAALQAQAPGLSVMQNSGQIGGAAVIRLRGNTSAAMSNQPLVYIDGIRVRSEPYPNPSGGSGRRSNNEHHSPLNDLNPADIERIEIIKGAAASTLYGTEAAAGVIQIFTKSGSAGRAVWSLETQQGFQQLMSFAPEPEPYHYLDPWLKKGWQQQYIATVQGGSDALRYFMSGTIEDREGILPNESLERRAVRGNFSFAPLRGLDLTWNNFISASDIENVAGGVNSSGFIMAVYRQETNHISNADPEAISQFLNQEFRTTIDRLNSGITARYAPVSNWSTRLTLGYDRANTLVKRVTPWGFVLEPDGAMRVRPFRTVLATMDVSSTLDVRLTSRLTASLSGGGQFVSSDDVTVDGYAINFPGPGNPTLSSGAITTAEEDRQRVLTGGFFAQSLLGWNDRMFLTAGLRVDGSSVFGSGFGLQPYPKVSASYVIHEEPFWNPSWGELKLRAAVGSAGRAPGAFDAIRTWNPIGWGTNPAYLPQNLGNADLGPERTLETEVGFDASFLNGRVSTDFTYYHGNTKDALFSVRSVPSTGFQSSQLKNVGEIENKGVELSLNATVLQRQGWNWTMGTTIATNHSKVLDLGEAVPLSLGNRGWLLEGEPLMVMRGVKLLNPDEIADPIVETDHLFGPNYPTRIIGLHTTLQLPFQISLTARGEYQGGHYVSDGATEDNAARNVVSRPTCLSQQALLRAGRGDELTARDRLLCDSRHYRAGSFIQKADFFKLRDVNARFPVPFGIPGASSAFVTLAAHNWIRWVNSEFPIFEPEMGSSSGAALDRVRGLGTGVTPPPATFTASLRVVF